MSEKSPTETAVLRVVCADDNADIVRMLKLLIDREDGMVCACCTHNAQGVIDFLRDADTGAAPVVILLDLTMPGLDPLDAIAEISRDRPDARVLVYSGHDDPAVVKRVMDAGAWGLVAKHEGPDTILTALRRVGNGEVVMPRC
jgi:DNA-binding NarL/FixJ family response regulator